MELGLRSIELKNCAAKKDFTTHENAVSSIAEAHFVINERTKSQDVSSNNSADKM